MKNSLILVLVIINLACILTSHVSFKKSATSPDWRGILSWQVVGHLAGFISVLALTGVMRYLPLHQANAISVGLSFALVQVVGARLIFREEVSRLGWAGAAMIVGGVVLISSRR